MKLSLAVTSLTTAAASALSAADLEAPSPEAVQVTAVADHVSGATDLRGMVNNASTRSRHSNYRFVDQPEAWNKAMNRRFFELLALEVDGQLSPEQEAEYARLRQDRERLVLAPTPQEILHDLRQLKAVESLTAAMRKVIEIYGGADQER